MTCEKIEAELIAYHFGTASEEARGAIEDHLPHCPSCVRALLALKRDLEATEDAPAPSRAARDRLRRAVAREVSPERPTLSWRWWERPLVLAGAFAVLLGATALAQRVSVREGVAPRAMSRMEK